MEPTSGVPEFEKRYPLHDWIEDLKWLTTLPPEKAKGNLAAQIEGRFQELYPDIHNEPDRGQMLLDALQYIETNIEGLSSGAALVAGRSQYLVNPELAVSLYFAHMKMPAGMRLMDWPIIKIIESANWYRKQWGPPQ